MHLPGLQVLDARQHVQMTRRVLLDHVHDIVWPQALFEPPLRHKKLHDAVGGSTFCLDILSYPKGLGVTENINAGSVL